MEYQNIDKAIYQLPEIRRSLRPQRWALVCIILGGVAAYCYLTGHTSSLWLGLLFIGAFAFVSMICFYTIGDCHQPIHKPTRQRLERTYSFYGAACKDALLSALQADDETALDRVKKGANPELVLVRYSSDDGSIRYSQLKEPQGKKFVAASDLFSHQPQTNQQQ